MEDRPNSNRTDLDALLSRCRDGDQLAWEELVRCHQSRVFAIAYHLTGNREEAWDLAQETFVRIYENLSACREGRHFLPWMIRIARNLCIDRLRRRRARPPAQDIPAAEALRLSSSGPNPEQQFEEASRRRLIHRALQTLSALNREMIVLKDIQGLTLEEIARLLRVPLGTLKSRSHRARLELNRAVLALAGGSGGPNR